jgi:hypothetical protein
MDATILNINIDNNKNMIQIKVLCNKCKNISYHNITHATDITKNNLCIDFSKFGKRCCDNIKCDADYFLYK